MASLRGIIRKALKADPLTSALVKLEKDVPGSVGSALTAITAENVSSNPYKEGERSRWDIFAGGDKLSQDPEARQTGRAIGTAAAIFFGAGAAGASGSTATTAAATGTQAINSKLAADAAEAQSARDAEAQRQTIEQGLARLRQDPAPQARIDMARRRAEEQDIMRRRRGRRASILTGDTGVGTTPIGQRTLLGT